MWNWLLNGIKALFDSLFYVGREAWRQTGILLGNAWAFFIAIGTFVVTVVNYANESINDLVGYGDALLGTAWPNLTVPGTFTNLFSLANTFLPVNEGIAMLFLLLLVISIGSAYRFIKSWIPTLS